MYIEKQIDKPVLGHMMKNGGHSYFMQIDGTRYYMGKNEFLQIASDMIQFVTNTEGTTVKKGRPRNTKKDIAEFNKAFGTAVDLMKDVTDKKEKEERKDEGESTEES